VGSAMICYVVLCYVTNFMLTYFKLRKLCSNGFNILYENREFTRTNTC